MRSGIGIPTATAAIPAVDCTIADDGMF